MAIAILLASEQCGYVPEVSKAFTGELSLTGTIRLVRSIIGKLLVAERGGIKAFYIPIPNVAPAQLIPDITLVSVGSCPLAFSLSFCRPKGRIWFFSLKNADIPIDLCSLT